MSESHLFVARNVTAIMPQQNGGKTTIFSNLQFSVDSGEIVDITGPSGSGKSTLLTAFARLNVNTTGKFFIHSKDSDTFTPQAWRMHVAYLPQASTLIGESVADAIRLPWKFKIRHGEVKRSPEAMLSDNAMRKLLDNMGCADIPLDRNPRELSGGQAARVSLARTILTKPQVLLADEVDAGLDTQNADKVADLLKQAAQEGAAVVRIRHRAPDGRATRIMELANGTLTQISAQEEAKTQAENGASGE